jgi:hypothetical protein
MNARIGPANSPKAGRIGAGNNAGRAVKGGVLKGLHSGNSRAKFT